MKELPWFKFHVSEWINGNITLEPLEEQGAFINICAHYWFKDGNLSIEEAKRRLTQIKPNAFQSLIKKGFLKSNKGFLKISFLDEQLAKREKKSIVNSHNGSLGGRPKKSEQKPNALISESESKAKQKAIREEGEEEKKKREKNIFFNTQVAKLLSKPYEAGPDRGLMGTGQDIDSLVLELHTRGWDNEKIISEIKAMKAFYIKRNLTFPTQYLTILKSLTETAWKETLKELDPEHQAETIRKAKQNGQAETDTIGTSAPGSLG